jgi:hypothetical protein
MLNLLNRAVFDAICIWKSICCIWYSRRQLQLIEVLRVLEEVESRIKHLHVHDLQLRQLQVHGCERPFPSDPVANWVYFEYLQCVMIYTSKYPDLSFVMCTRMSVVPMMNIRRCDFRFWRSVSSKFGVSLPSLSLMTVRYCDIFLSFLSFVMTHSMIAKLIS